MKKFFILDLHFHCFINISIRSLLGLGFLLYDLRGLTFHQV